MIFRETELEGAYIVELEIISDHRGFFARSWCQKEFEEKSLVSNFVQSNIAFNRKRNTLRGMHYQSAPFEEVKLVRCTKGAVYDVIVDLRPESPTHTKWIGVKLTPDNYKPLYVPKLFAHGYLTLIDNSELFYQVSQFYSPQHEAGVRWSDPVFSIDWPTDIKPIISKKDENWPDYTG
jgi:dTDP-4-dehydrorhamnose 3,5-epimerase